MCHPVEGGGGEEELGYRFNLAIEELAISDGWSSRDISVRHGLNLKNNLPGVQSF